MPDNFKGDGESSSVRGKRRRDEEPGAESSVSNETAAGQNPKSRFRSMFGKLVDIITQPEDNDLMLEDDDEGIEDIFSDDTGDNIVPGIVPPAVYEQDTEKAIDPDLPVDNDAEEEGVLYTSEPATPQTTPKKTEQEKPQSSKTEITLEDVLKAKNDSSGRRVFCYNAEASESEELPENEKAHDYKNELSHDATPVKSPVNKVRKDELSRALPEKQAAPAPTDRKNELSHEAVPVKPTVKKDELSRALPEKPDAPAPTDRKNELSHEATPVKPTVKKDELSRELPEKPDAPAPTDRKNELSHDAAPVKQTVKKDESPKETVTENKPEPKTSTENVKRESRPEAAVSPGKTDFSENKPEPMVYRSGDGSELVVMAGKFTKTLRAEYENVRRLRGTEFTAEKKEKPKPVEEKPAQSEKTEEPSPEPPKKKKRRFKNILERDDTAVKKQGKRFGFKLSDIFGNVDYELEDMTDDDSPQKPQLDDYGSEEDAEEIRGDINENYRQVFVRTIVLGCTCLGALVNAFIAQVFPSLYLDAIHNGWLVYGAIGFLLFGISVFVSRYPIVNGLMPLRKLKGNSDTPIAVASVAAALQSVTSLFLPDVFINGTYHAYLSLVILALLLNSIGKLLIIRRTALNFRFLRNGDQKFAGKIYTNTARANEFVNGLPARRPIIAYAKKSRFMSNFLQLSYCSDPVEDMSAFIAPFAAILSVVCGLAYGIITKDFVGGVSSFALTACITTPMCSLLVINIPMMRLCRTSLSDGAMVAGYESVRQFCDTNAIMLDSADLYPKGSIILSGLKAFNDSLLDDALLAGAAVNFAVDGPLTYIFETILQNRRNLVPDVDSVLYDDGLGLSGWIGGRRILIGTRELLMKHNITPPEEKVEKKYRKMGNELTYISIGGELIAMLVLTYKANRETARALRRLEDSGVSFVVRTIDPNITADHIAEKFSLLPRCIRILPTGLGAVCTKELSGTEKASRAYLVTNGRLSAFASAVAGCIGLKSTVFFAKLIQGLSLGVGVALVTLISFISGFAKLGSMELLLYIGFWCIALVLASLFARRIS